MHTHTHINIHICIYLFIFLYTFSNTCIQPVYLRYKYGLTEETPPQNQAKAQNWLRALRPSGAMAVIFDGLIQCSFLKNMNLRQSARGKGDGGEQTV